MGYVTNDPKKSDEQQPGGSGLMMDLGLMACPACGREVPDWKDTCPDCGVKSVPITQTAAKMPDIPAHLLDDETEDADAEE
ncbi:MAG: hypothetical protein ACR2HR_00550 [Euzebya sp.]